MALFRKFLIRDDGVQDNIRDIVENLNNILNTKRGYGSVLDDYGIRDINEFNDKNGMAEIIVDEVIRCITKYEPRVEVVQVEKEAGGGLFQISFTIQCMIQETRQTMNMVFDTVGNQFMVENKNK